MTDLKSLPDHIGVLTLNIWFNRGDWSARKQAIKKWIAKLQPDVIALQEVLYGDGYNQLDELFQGTDYKYAVYGAACSAFWMSNFDSSKFNVTIPRSTTPNHRASPGILEESSAPSPASSGMDLHEFAYHGTTFGNAVVSRWPIVDFAELKLPHNRKLGMLTRSAVNAQIQTPYDFGTISVTSTHLDHRLTDSVDRMKQIQALLAFVRSKRVQPSVSSHRFPDILMGDFNAEPDSDEMRYMRGLAIYENKSTFMQDAWIIAGDGPRDQGFTWDNKNPHAFEDFEISKRLDYIYTSYPSRDGVGVVEKCQVVCNDDIVGGTWPSDHFGVMAQIRAAPLKRFSKL